MSGRSLARRAFSGLLTCSGIVALARKTSQRNALTVALFHDPSPDEFARHVRVLQSRYSIVGLRAGLDALRSVPGAGLPPYPLALTFDDGHASNFALLNQFQALPAKPTVFLCSAIAGTDRGFWFRCLPPGIPSKRFKAIPDDERIAALGRTGFDPMAPRSARQALSVREIDEMRPWTDFQAHTRFHPCLPHCTDAAANLEIAGCRTELRERFGIDATILAYPNGDHTPRDVALTAAAGFEYGISTIPGVNVRSTDQFRIRRVSMNEQAHDGEIATRATGLIDRLRPWLGGE